MLLKNLIKNSPQNLKELKIKGLALNSNQVKKGYIFFALKGNKSNGEDYIGKAIKNGAILIICSKKCKFQSSKIYILKVNNVRNLLINITDKYYKIKPRNIIAVTGTNGKTSVAEYFYQILNKNKIPVASIGTLGIKFKSQRIKTSLTTPDIITLHKYLEIIKKNKIDNVIIEASSHGLYQKRLNKLNIKAAIFTNFSQDHLDYHKTMKSYFQAKMILFSKLLKEKKYIIADKSIKQFSILKKISKRKKLKVKDISKVFAQIEKMHLPLTGSFQNKNLSMAILAAVLCKVNYTEIKRSIKKISNIEGRLELIKKFSNNRKVFIDYAHTPDALNEVLKSLKKKYNSKISLVFGCGGERDFKKRPLMARVAKSICDKVYVTDDNPRKENPKKIRKEIIKYLNKSNYKDIGNRSLAIKEAILNSEPNEIILVAGKGHENYQDYGNKIFSISDKKIIQSLKIKKKLIDKKKLNYLFNSRILNKITKSKKFYKFDGLSIDSREVKKDNLFLAIKGKINDGNQFINKAIRNGASYVISSKSKKRFKNKVIKVDNCISFLNKLAKLKRESCNAKILAITGSAGKTSLKNMLNALLSKHNNTYSSPRSFNNHYGVPISLSNLRYDHRFGVFEVGMSKSGEIDKLSKIVRPHLAIITNVAEAHIENFKNINGIANAKGEIINNIQNNGTIILNRDDRFFHYLNKKAKSKNIKVITFGKSKYSDIKLLKIKRLHKFNRITVQTKEEHLKFETKNINIYNVLASLAVLKELKFDLKKEIKEFKKINPSDGRGKIHLIKRYKKNFKLVDESYNANPFSMKNALMNYSQIKKNGSKKYLFLGDMLELGKKSEFYHKQLSKLINSSDIDKVFIKGEKTLFTYKNLKKDKRGNILQCDQDVDLILKKIIANNDYLMIKGSNASGLNAITKAMIKGD